MALHTHARPHLSPCPHVSHPGHISFMAVNAMHTHVLLMPSSIMCSQAKIEIYGLWCALQAYQLYIIGVKNLQVEINASYIKRMLNNPDIQPGTLVSRWIIGIKLFQL